MRSDFLRIGVDAMRDLQAIDVSIVLELTAYEIVQRLPQDSKDAGQQKNHRERRPVAQTAQPPLRPELSKCPGRKAIDEIKTHQQARRRQEQSINNVVQHVMPHL